MRLLRTANLALLFFAGLGLAVANVWISANRSTIPLQLNGRVDARENRTEKHPGKDDVYLMHLDPGGVVQVDRSVYEAVEVSDLVRKESWSRRLQVGSDLITLEWSRDVYGMIVAMPLVCCVLLVTTVCVWSTNQPGG